MSALHNKKLIWGIFAELSLGKTRAFTEALADDVRWTFPGNWSWSGTWAPKTAVLDELLGPLMAQFAGSYRSEADFILAEGDRVVVQAHGHATTTRGDAYDQAYLYIFRIRDGRITEVIEHCDTALVERVLDAPSPQTRVRPASAQPSRRRSSPKASTGPSAPDALSAPSRTASAAQARMSAVKS